MTSSDGKTGAADWSVSIVWGRIDGRFFVPEFRREPRLLLSLLFRGFGLGDSIAFWRPISPNRSRRGGSETIF